MHVNPFLAKSHPTVEKKALFRGKRTVRNKRLPVNYSSVFRFGSLMVVLSEILITIRGSKKPVSLEASDLQLIIVVLCSEKQGGMFSF